jgi:hypothetical protein
MAASVSSLDTDYDRWAVTAPSNPTQDVVQFAYLQAGSADPTAGNWFSGVWEAAALSTGEWVAKALLGPGPGGHVLTPGTWDVWIKITDSPTIPVRQIGTLTIT